MEAPNDFTRANVMKWIKRLHVKTYHTQYTNDEIKYGNYKWYINTTINAIRHMYLGSYWDEEQLDLIWQNLNLAGPNWRHVRENIFTAIAS